MKIKDIKRLLERKRKGIFKYKATKYPTEESYIRTIELIADREELKVKFDDYHIPDLYISEESFDNKHSIYQDDYIKVSFV